MVLLMMPVVMGSCSDDDDEPSAIAGKVNIRNSSTYTLSDFMVNFTNDKGEIITREEKGTLKPNDVVSVDIPIGATYYYMSTVMSGYRFFSPDYSTSVRQQVLTTQTVGNWLTN